MLTVDLPKSSLGHTPGMPGLLIAEPPALRPASVIPAPLFELQCLNLTSAVLEVESLLQRFGMVADGLSREQLWAPLIDDGLADQDSQRYRLLESLLVRAAHRHAAWRIDTKDLSDQPAILQVRTALPLALAQQILVVLEPASQWLGLVPSMERLPDAERPIVLRQLLA